MRGSDDAHAPPHESYGRVRSLPRADPGPPAAPRDSAHGETAGGAGRRRQASSLKARDSGPCSSFPRGRLRPMPHRSPRAAPCSASLRRRTRAESGPAAWLNQVERWLGLITSAPFAATPSNPFPIWCARSSSSSPPTTCILNPFMWTATADSILAKLERLSKVISGTKH